VSAGELVTCAACGETTPAGKFCIHCGSPMQQRCSACGEVLVSGAKFCLECGTPVGAEGVQARSSAAGETVSERRLVSVLFADLVGFTTLSEHRDPEEVRELLGSYFDRCRTLIERYGGTVEKFIGDAVMAVWGTPVAREDDAERAVRAALALTQAVSLLAEEVEMPGLRVRAGVLTGHAAVELGAEGEGMVLGDTVNTASRLQSIAAPGTVLVDDVTHRVTEAAIVYEDAGTHEVKGREQSVHAWTALRVVAGVGGAMRTAGLEAPFVGRDRELALVVEPFEATVEEQKARFVAAVGEAGTGKSRLLWEFYKYIDGVEKTVRWHQGRCLSYGEGVAYWALAEMIRRRAEIVEEEDAGSARAKLRATVEQYVTDERERRLVEPRLAQLLGLEQRIAADRADLFSGWRLFLERLSEDSPVILAFEDLQWADSGLLEFIDYLLEWSGEHPLFVLALGRSELLEKRPEWADHAIKLGPLPDAAMREALEGLVPGLPEEVTARILQQAEGVPLYAVETVRMLLDRGLVTEEGSRYVMTGDVSELDVPESLHALAAARLDGLSGAERAVIQDAAVFGQSFTPAGVASLGNCSPREVQEALDRLVSKQVLGLNDDPRSPERGQYHFLQGLLRTTAHATLSRRDRKARHLAAARHLQEAWGEEAPELAEVLAAHFLEAADADPDAADAPRIRAAACETLADAGQRALSLALAPEAQRAFDRAAELAEDDSQRAAMLDRAGRAALMNADFEAGRERLNGAIAIFEQIGDRESAARSLVDVARSLFQDDRLDEALDLNRRAVAGLPEGSAEKAASLAALARHLSFLGEFGEALSVADAALGIAEPLEEWRTIVIAFDVKAFVRLKEGHIQEALALRQRGLALALDQDLGNESLAMYNNTADLPLQLDRFAEAAELARRGLELARARGQRGWEQSLGMLVTTAEVARGNWDVLPELDETGLPRTSELHRLAFLSPLARVQAGRGDLEALQRTLLLATEREGSSNVEFAAIPAVARAIALRALGRGAEALEAALPIALSGPEVANEDRREAYVEAGLAALELGDEEALERLIEFVGNLPPALRSPLLRAGAARFAGLLAARRGDIRAADERLAAATGELREIESPFNLGQVLLEHAEVLSSASREDEATPLVAEARGIFERLGAEPLLQRTDSLAARVAV
jgi:class 3 adenylate cyclase